MDELTLRGEIVSACRAMQTAGLTRGTSGNVSARVADGMLITPSAVPYGQLEPDMLIHVVLDRARLASAGFLADARAEAETHVAGLRRSTEWRLHAAILLARPDVNAVLHAHPPFGTALACTRRGIPPFHYMVAIAGGHDIRCAEYATFGTAELATRALAALSDRNACLLANHGVVAVGTTPDRALALAIEVEALAEQYCHALTLGEPVLLSVDEMTRVRDAFSSYVPHAAG